VRHLAHDVRPPQDDTRVARFALHVAYSLFTHTSSRQSRGVACGIAERANRWQRAAILNCKRTSSISTAGIGRIATRDAIDFDSTSPPPLSLFLSLCLNLLLFSSSLFVSQRECYHGFLRADKYARADPRRQSARGATSVA